LPEEDVLGDGQVGRNAELLVHHADAGGVRVARPSGKRTGWPSSRKRAVELGVHAGDDLHQRALAGAVLANETVDLAGMKREVDTTKRFDAAEALRDALEFQDGPCPESNVRLETQIRK
jgi:hypothetical protein